MVDAFNVDPFGFNESGQDSHDDIAATLSNKPNPIVLAHPSKTIPSRPKECKTAGLCIVPYKTNKKKIKQRPMMEKAIIPKHPASVIFNGRSGSGKSNLIINLLTRPEFYGPPDKGYFDIIYLFSPTAKSDDLPEYLGLEDKRIFTDFDLGALDKIIETQEKIIHKKGINKSPKILLLLDDIQSDAKFLRSKQIKRCFIQNRHLNISTWLAGQSFKLTPRCCRLQAMNVIYFPGSGSEIECLCEEFIPPKMSKKAFIDLINYATADRYNFLHIAMNEAPKTRFRKNLNEILELVD